MNFTLAQGSPWDPYEKGKGKKPIPESANYGVAFMLAIASLYVIIKTLREQRNK